MFISAGPRLLVIDTLVVDQSWLLKILFYMLILDNNSNFFLHKNMFVFFRFREIQIVYIFFGRGGSA